MYALYSIMNIVNSGNAFTGTVSPSHYLRQNADFGKCLILRQMERADGYTVGEMRVL